MSSREPPFFRKLHIIRESVELHINSLLFNSLFLFNCKGSEVHLGILYHEICLCVWVCVRNRLPNHAHYGDENFTGDLIDLEEGRRLKLIFKDAVKPFKTDIP